MRIFKFGLEVAPYARLEVPDRMDLRVFVVGFKAEPMAAGWRPPRVRLDRDDLAEGRLIPDFPSIAGAIPALSARAVAALGGLLENCGELLPLECEDGEYFVFNVLAEHDVMDEAQSRTTYLKPGVIMTLDRLALNDRHPQGLSPIFKLPQWRKGNPLLTESFVDAVEREGLTGLRSQCIT